MANGDDNVIEIIFRHIHEGVEKTASAADEIEKLAKTAENADKSLSKVPEQLDKISKSVDGTAGTLAVLQRAGEGTATALTAAFEPLVSGRLQAGEATVNALTASFADFVEEQKAAAETGKALAAQLSVFKGGETFAEQLSQDFARFGQARAAGSFDWIKKGLVDQGLPEAVAEDFMRAVFSAMSAVPGELNFPAFRRAIQESGITEGFKEAIAAGVSEKDFRAALATAAQAAIASAKKEAEEIAKEGLFKEDVAAQTKRDLEEVAAQFKAVGKEVPLEEVERFAADLAALSKLPQGNIAALMKAIQVSTPSIDFQSLKEDALQGAAQLTGRDIGELRPAAGPAPGPSPVPGDIFKPQELEGDFGPIADEMAKVEDQAIKLANALQKIGVSLPTEELFAFASETATAFQTTEKAVLAVLGGLASGIQGLGTDELKALTEVILELSNATGTDLKKATIDAVKVLNGLGDSIGGVTIKFDEGASTVERTAAIVEQVSARIANSFNAEELRGPGISDEWIDGLEKIKASADVSFGAIAEGFERLQEEAKNMSEALSSVGIDLPADEIRVFAEEIASTFRTAETNVINTMGAIAQQVQGLTSDQLKDLTEGVIASAKVFGIDLPDAVQQTIDVLKGAENAMRGMNIAVADGLPFQARADALIESFAPNVKEAAEEAEDFGKKAAESGGGVEALNTAMTSLGAITGTVNPQLANLAKALAFVTSGAGLTVAGIGALVSALGAVAKSVSDTGVQLNKLAKVSGISIETLSGLKISAEQNESSLGELSIALRTFNREIAQALLQGGAAQKQFIDLGFTFKDLVGFFDNTEQALEQVAKKITAAASASEKNRLAQQFFGRTGRELLLLLEDIANKGLPALRQEAEKMGLIWSQDMVAAAKQFNNATTQLGQSLEALKLKIGGPLLQSIADFITTLSQIPRSITITIDVIKGSLPEIPDWVKRGIARTDVRTLIPGLKEVAQFEKLIGDPAARAMKMASELGATEIERAVKERTAIEQDLAQKTAEGMGKGGQEGAQEILKALQRAVTPEEIAKIIAPAFALGIEGGRAAAEERQKQKLAAEELTKARQREVEARRPTRQQAIAGLTEELNRPDVLRGESPGEIEARKRRERELLEVRKLNAEINKTLVQTAIQTSSQYAEQLGEIGTFIQDAERQLAEFRRAALVPIDVQFQQEKDVLAPGVAEGLRGARVKAVDIQVEQQRRDLALKASQIQLKTEEDLRQATEARAKSIETLAQAQVDAAKQSLDLLIKQGASEAEILKLATQLEEKEKDILATRVKTLTAQQDEIRKRLVELGLDEAGEGLEKLGATARAEAEKLLARIRELAGEITKIQGQQAQPKTVVTGARAAVTASREPQLQVEETRLRSISEILREQVGILEDQRAVGIEVPMAETLALAKQIDTIDDQLLQIAISRKEEEVKLSEARFANKEISEAELEASRKQLDILRIQREAAQNREFNRAVINVAKQVESAATRLAGDFVDRFIDLLETGMKSKGGFLEQAKAFSVNLGRTIVTQIGQELLKEALKPQIEAIIKATGKEPTSMADLLIQSIKVGLGIKTDKVKTPEVAATEENTAASDANTLALDRVERALIALASIAPGAPVAQAAPIINLDETVPKLPTDEIFGNIETWLQPPDEIIAASEAYRQNLTVLNQQTTTAAGTMSIMAGGCIRTGQSLGILDQKSAGLAGSLMTLFDTLRRVDLGSIGDFLKDPIKGVGDFFGKIFGGGTRAMPSAGPLVQSAGELTRSAGVISTQAGVASQVLTAAGGVVSQGGETLKSAGLLGAGISLSQAGTALTTAAAKLTAAAEALAKCCGGGGGGGVDTGMFPGGILPETGWTIDEAAKKVGALSDEISDGFGDAASQAIDRIVANAEIFSESLMESTGGLDNLAQGADAAAQGATGFLGMLSRLGGGIVELFSTFATGVQRFLFSLQGSSGGFSFGGLFSAISGIFGIFGGGISSSTIGIGTGAAGAGAGGGAVTMGQVRAGYAKGTIATKPTVGVFGEAGPEVVAGIRHSDKGGTPIGTLYRQSDTIFATMGKTHEFAKGTIATAPTVGIFGEAGPEVVAGIRNSDKGGTPIGALYKQSDTIFATMSPMQKFAKGGMFSSYGNITTGTKRSADTTPMMIMPDKKIVPNERVQHSLAAMARPMNTALPRFATEAPPRFHTMQISAQRDSRILDAVAGGNERVLAGLSSLTRGIQEQDETPWNIVIWDKRPQGLSRNDVLVTVADDMERNGRTAKAVKTTTKRNRNG